MPQPTSAEQEHSAQIACSKAYSRWAPVYDLIFDLPFHPGRVAAAGAVGRAAGPGGRILVVGVGTGLELGLLPTTARVTGIDLSRPMLDQARERVERKAMSHVKSLRVMDAGALDFGAAAFDVAFAPYVLSVVPSPARALDEMWRVTRPGGELVILNHFAAAGGLRARAEAWLGRAATWLGWHPDFPFSAVGDWLAAQEGAELVEERLIAPFGLFTLLRIRKEAPRA